VAAGVIRCSGAVLAGGDSKRLGQAKAFVEINGRTLLNRAVDCLVQAGVEPVTVVGGEHDRIRAAGHEPIPDRFPGDGPLGGILSALHSSEREAVAILACDLADPDPAEIQRLLGALTEGDVAVPVVGSHPQWLFSVWRRSAREPLGEAFADGVRAPRHAINELQVVYLPGLGDRFRDIDTPEDLDRERSRPVQQPDQPPTRLDDWLA